jgi:Na+/melibiose symporter-like transporter
MYLLFNDDSVADGRFVIENYHQYGWFNAVGVVLFSILCIAGTWHYIPKLLESTASKNSNLLRNIVGTFKNHNFRYLVLVEAAAGGLGGIVSALLMVSLTYFWEFDTLQISLLLGGPPLLAVLIVVTTSRKLNAALEKQQMLQLSCFLGLLNLLWLTPLKLFEVFPSETGIFFVLVFLNYAIAVSTGIIRTIANQALLADIADEHELATGLRQEGVMFAAAFFAAKFISGFGYLVAGPFLDIIGLEASMLPGEAPRTVIVGLGVLLGPVLAAAMILPLWMSLKLKVSLAGQIAVREALAARR